MTEEEILRKKLDWINQNSYYGIMIDTEITDIVRRHIKRLEEKEMNATSVQNIKDVKDISFSIENDIVKMESKLTIVASTYDDIFAFEFEGPDLLQSCKATGLFTGWDKDQKIRELEEELNEWKKEASEYLKDVDGVRREKNKEINELKQKLQQAEHDKRRYEEKIKNLKHADMLDREAADAWSKEYYNLSKKFDELKEEHEKLEAKSKDISDDNALLLETNKELKKELALEKAANEAQHKFIREYAGKGTEVQFNYAIDDAKEVSYAIVDKEENECKCESCSAGASYEEMYRKLIDDLKEENKKLKEENFCVKSRINAFKNTNGKLQDEVLELKYQLKDIQTTKEVVEQKLNTRASILDQAKKCVCGQREQDYGTPESNFQLIADLWNGYLGFTSYVLELEEYLMDLKDKGIDIDINVPEPKAIFPEDVAMMMALMKIARIRNGGGSGDSFVDLAGYAACGGEIWHGQKVKDQN